MKELDLIVSVEHYSDEYGTDIDLSVKIEDGMYDRMIAFAQKCHDSETEFSEEMFEENLPDIYKYIGDRVDEMMPGEINLEEDQEIEDFSWHVEYPEDICEMLLDI